MKKAVLLMIGCIFLSVTVISSVHAFPYSTNLYNKLGIESYEVLIDGDEDGAVSIGDIFWGVAKVDNIFSGTNLAGDAGTELWLRGGSLGGPAEITAYFVQEVKNIYIPGSDFPDGTSVPSTQPIIELGWDSDGVDPNNILDDGVTLQWFLDDELNFNSNSQSLALTTSTDGTPDWTMTFGAGANGSPSGYFYTEAPVTPPGIGTDVGQTYGGLNWLDGPTGSVLVYDPDESISDNLMNISGYDDTGLLVDLFFNAEVSQVADITDTDKMHFYLNDPAVHGAVPEPATMVLLGVGLLGLAGFGRKKLFKD